MQWNYLSWIFIAMSVQIVAREVRCVSLQANESDISMSTARPEASETENTANNTDVAVAANTTTDTSCLEAFHNRDIYRDPDTIVRLPQYANITYTVPDHFKKSAKILFWTPLYGKHDHWFWWFGSTQHRKFCPQLNCEFTVDKADVNSSDAVVFMIYGKSFDLDGDVAAQLPSHRSDTQRYVFFTYEPPGLRNPQDLNKLNGVFNWTMTYRRDSDVRAHFGRILLNENIRNSDRNRNYALEKHKMIAWFVGHCNTEGQREKYVEELEKYVDVDVYGACGDRTCIPPRSHECYEMLSHQYKFYLSFENILCDDYVTEKFIKPLASDVVPVVFGGADYTNFGPRGSYIDALKYSSPRELADYLKHLDENDDEYNQFFDWKRGYDVEVLEHETWNCELCLKILDPDEPRKVYEDINSWWNDQSHCHSYKPLQ